MKKLFISQGYSHNPTEAYELAKKYSRQAVDAGYIPVSPVLMFHHIYNNNTEYHDVLYACFSLIKSCDAMWVADGARNSKGVAAEIAYARGLSGYRILFGDLENNRGNYPGITLSDEDLKDMFLP